MPTFERMEPTGFVGPAQPPPGGWRAHLLRWAEHATGKSPLDRSPHSLQHGPTPVRACRFPSFEQVPDPDGPWKLSDGRMTLLVDNAAVATAREERLWIMCFNILLSGIRRQALLEYFEGLEREGRLPDVIALQEANQEISVLLARKHRYHLAYFGQDFAPAQPGSAGRRRINGKAYLSRHRIVEANHYTYYAPPDLRHDAREAGGPDSIEEDRGALHAALEIEGLRTHLFNVHHSVGNALLNAQQMFQLLELARHQKPVIALGDFNANINLKRARRTAHAPAVPRTTSVEEYEERYGSVWSSVGDLGTGNIGDWRLRHELNRLESALPDSLCCARAVQVRLPGGELMLPKQAREILDQHQVERGSERWRRLRDIADASTLSSDPDPSGAIPATGKRFDGFFASRDLEVQLIEIDRSTESSDHQPIIGWFSR
jgi:endonuclease/exonuclease/phosphatase family metal-dependent hydrolase